MFVDVIVDNSIVTINYNEFILLVTDSALNAANARRAFYLNNNR